MGTYSLLGPVSNRKAAGCAQKEAGIPRCTVQLAHKLHTTPTYTLLGPHHLQHPCQSLAARCAPQYQEQVLEGTVAHLHACKDATDPDAHSQVRGTELHGGDAFNEYSQSWEHVNHSQQQPLYTVMRSLTAACSVSELQLPHEQQQLLLLLSKAEAAAARAWQRHAEKRSWKKGRRLHQHASLSSLHTVPGLNSNSAVGCQVTASMAEWSLLLARLDVLGVRMGPALLLLMYDEARPWKLGIALKPPSISLATAQPLKSADTASKAPEELAYLIRSVCPKLPLSKVQPAGSNGSPLSASTASSYTTNDEEAAMHERASSHKHASTSAGMPSAFVTNGAANQSSPQRGTQAGMGGFAETAGATGAGEWLAAAARSKRHIWLNKALNWLVSQQQQQQQQQLGSKYHKDNNGLQLDVMTDAVCAVARSDHAVAPDCAWLIQLYAVTLPVLQHQQHQHDQHQQRPHHEQHGTQQTHRDVQATPRQLDKLAWAVSKLVQAGGPAPPSSWLQALEAQLLMLCTHTHLELTQLRQLTASPLSSPSQNLDPPSSSSPQTAPPLDPAQTAVSSSNPSQGQALSDLSAPSLSASHVLYPPNPTQPLPPSTSLPLDGHSAASSCAPQLSSCRHAVQSCVAILASLTHINLAVDPQGRATTAGRGTKEAAGQQAMPRTTNSSILGSNGSGSSCMPPAPLTLCALSDCASAAAAAGLLPLTSCAELLWCLARQKWHPGQDWLATVSTQLIVHMHRGVGTQVTAHASADGRTRASPQVRTGVVGLMTEARDQTRDLLDEQGAVQLQHQQHHDHHQQQIQGQDQPGALNSTKALQALWALATLSNLEPTPRQDCQGHHQQQLLSSHLKKQQHEKSSKPNQPLGQSGALNKMGEPHTHFSISAALAQPQQQLLSTVTSSKDATQHTTASPAAVSNWLPASTADINSKWLMLFLPTIEAGLPELSGPSKVSLFWSLAVLVPSPAAASEAPSMLPRRKQTMTAKLVGERRTKAQPAGTVGAEQGQVDRPTATDGQRSANVDAKLLPALYASNGQGQVHAVSAGAEAHVLALLHALLPSCTETLHTTSPHMLVMVLWSAARLLPTLHAARHLQHSPEVLDIHSSTNGCKNSSTGSINSSTGNNSKGTLSSQTVLNDGHGSNEGSMSNSSSTGENCNSSSMATGHTMNSASALTEAAAGYVGRGAAALAADDLVTAARALLDLGWSGASWSWVRDFACACRLKLQELEHQQVADLLEALTHLLRHSQQSLLSLHPQQANQQQEQQQHPYSQQEQQQRLPSHMQMKLRLAACKVSSQGSGDGVHELMQLGACSAQAVAQALSPQHSIHQHKLHRRQPLKQQQQEEGGKASKHALPLQGQQTSVTHYVNVKQATQLLEALNGLLHILLLHCTQPARRPSMPAEVEVRTAATPMHAGLPEGALCEALCAAVAQAEGYAAGVLRTPLAHSAPGSRKQAWAKRYQIQLLGGAAELRATTQAWLKHRQSNLTQHTMHTAALAATSTGTDAPTAHMATPSSRRSSSSSGSIFSTPFPTSRASPPFLVRPRASPSLQTPKPISNTPQTPALTSSALHTSTSAIFSNSTPSVNPNFAPSSFPRTSLVDQLHAAVVSLHVSPLPPPSLTLTSLLTAQTPHLLSELQALQEFNPHGTYAQELSCNPSTHSEGASDAPPAPPLKPIEEPMHDFTDMSMTSSSRRGRNQPQQEQNTSPSLPPHDFIHPPAAQRFRHHARAQLSSVLVLLLHVHAVWRVPVAPKLLEDAHRFLAPFVPDPAVALQLLQALGTLRHLHLLPSSPAQSHAHHPALPQQHAPSLSLPLSQHQPPPSQLGLPQPHIPPPHLAAQPQHPAPFAQPRCHPPSPQSQLQPWLAVQTAPSGSHALPSGRYSSSGSHAHEIAQVHSPPQVQSPARAVGSSSQQGTDSHLQLTALLVASWLGHTHTTNDKGTWIPVAGAPFALPAQVQGALSLISDALEHNQGALLPSLLPRLLHFLAKQQQLQQQSQRQQTALSSLQYATDPFPAAHPHSPSIFGPAKPHSATTLTRAGRSSSSSSTSSNNSSSHNGSSSSCSSSSSSSALWLRRTAIAHPAATAAALRQLQLRVWLCCVHAPLLQASVPAQDVVWLLHALGRLRWAPPQAWHHSNKPQQLHAALLHMLWPSHPPAATGPAQQSNSANVSDKLHALPPAAQHLDTTSPAPLNLGDLCCLLWSLSSLRLAHPGPAWLSSCYQRICTAVGVHRVQIQATPASTTQMSGEDAQDVTSHQKLQTSTAQPLQEGFHDLQLQTPPASAPQPVEELLAESWVSLLWAAARFEQAVHGEASGGAEVGSDRGRFRVNRGREATTGDSSCADGCSSNEQTGGGGGSDANGKEPKGGGSEQFHATMESGCPVLVACGWLPTACHRIAAGVGGLSGSSLGCVVWGSGVLLRGLAGELTEGNIVEAEAGAGGDSAGKLGAGSVPAGDAVSEQVEHDSNSSSKQVFGSTAAHVVSAMHSLVHLQAVALEEVQRRLLLQQPFNSSAAIGGRGMNHDAGQPSTPKPRSKLPHTPAKAPTQLSQSPKVPAGLVADSSPAHLSQPSPPASRSRAAAQPSTAELPPRTPQRIDRLTGARNSRLQQAGLPLSAVLSACAGVLQGRAALSMAASHLRQRSALISTNSSSAAGQPQVQAAHSAVVNQLLGSAAVLGAALRLVNSGCGQPGSGQGVPKVLQDSLISGLASTGSPHQAVTCLKMLARFKVAPSKELRLQLYALLLPPLVAVGRSSRDAQQPQQLQQHHSDGDRPSHQQWEQNEECTERVWYAANVKELGSSSLSSPWQQQLDVPSVVCVALSLACLRIRTPPPMSSVLVRALMAVLPFIATHPGTQRPVFGSTFGAVVWALVRLGAQLDGPAAALLLAEVSRRLRLCALSSSALVHVLWGLAKLSALQTWHPAEPLLEMLFASLLDVVPELGISDVSRVVWASASLNTKPPEALLHALTTQAMPEICSASPHTLTTLLYGFAALGYRPPATFFTSFYQATTAAMKATPVLKCTSLGSGSKSSADKHSSSSKKPTTVFQLTGSDGMSSSDAGGGLGSSGSAGLKTSNGRSSKKGRGKDSSDDLKEQRAAKTNGMTVRGLARTLWALAALRKDPPKPWLAMVTRRLMQELPNCNAHDLTLAALGCAVLGPRLDPCQIKAFGAAVERQRLRRLAVQYERDKEAMVWAWGRLHARIKIDEEELQHQQKQPRGLRRAGGRLLQAQDRHSYH